MALVAQRFSGSPTLQACAAGGHRMMAGEPDSDAVRRLQESLDDIGFPCGVTDGRFGNNTGDAVVAFKRAMGLSPDDPVIGVGTMTALDGFFDWEPADPDAPDPTTAGLPELVQSTISGTLVPLLRTSLAALQVGLDGLPHPGDPRWVDAEAALDRNMRLDLDPAARNSNRRDIADVVDACLRLLDPGGFLAVRPMDRAQFAAFDLSQGRIGTPIYSCSTDGGGHFTVTPPFRNVLDDEDRAMHVLRAALRVVRPNLLPAAYPGTKPFDDMGTAARLASKTAYQALVVELGSGLSATFRNPPLWF